MDPQTVRIDPTQLVELADLIAERLAKRESVLIRGELNHAEAAEYCGFGEKSVSTFRRWAESRHIQPISQGRWRVTALDRAMGGINHGFLRLRDARY